MLSFCTEVMVLLMPSVLGVGVLFLKEAPLSPYILRNLRPSSFRIGERIDFIDFNYASCTKTAGVYKICKRLILLRCFDCAEYIFSCIIRIECCSQHTHPSTL